MSQMEGNGTEMLPSPRDWVCLTQFQQSKCDFSLAAAAEMWCGVCSLCLRSVQLAMKPEKTPVRMNVSLYHIRSAYHQVRWPRRRHSGCELEKHPSPWHSSDSLLLGSADSWVGTSNGNHGNCIKHSGCVPEDQLCFDGCGYISEFERQRRVEAAEITAARPKVQKFKSSNIPEVCSNRICCGPGQKNTPASTAWVFATTNWEINITPDFNLPKNLMSCSTTKSPTWVHIFRR